MPTIRKRVQVTPSDEVWEAIDRLHALTGRPKAGLIAEMLDVVAPTFLEQYELLTKIQRMPDQARDLVRNFGVETIGKISQQLLDLPPVPKKRGRPRKHAAP
jgi:hypothetical protein